MNYTEGMRVTMGPGGNWMYLTGENAYKKYDWSMIPWGIWCGNSMMMNFVLYVAYRIVTDLGEKEWKTFAKEIRKCDIAKEKDEKATRNHFLRIDGYLTDELLDAIEHYLDEFLGEFRPRSVEGMFWGYRGEENIGNFRFDLFCGLVTEEYKQTAVNPDWKPGLPLFVRKK